MDEPKLENTLELLTRLNNTNSGIALSKEDRAREYVSQTFYKHQSTYQELQISNKKLKIDYKKLLQNQTLIKKTQSLGVQNMHLVNQNADRISKIRSLARRSQQVTNTTFRKKLKSIFQEISENIHQMLFGLQLLPQNWITLSTLCTWHQDISTLHINAQIHQAIMTSSFGILVDESTRGMVEQRWDFGNAKKYSHDPVNDPTDCNAPNLATFQISIPICEVFWDPPLPIPPTYIPVIPTNVV
ncbi:13261_t:CDS:2, partial [Funneliformis geosporum]